MGPSKLRSSISLTRGRADQALEGGSKVVSCPHKFCNTVQFRAGRPAKLGLKMARPCHFFVRFRASSGIFAEKILLEYKFCGRHGRFLRAFWRFFGGLKTSIFEPNYAEIGRGDPPKKSADQTWGVPAGKSPFSVGKTGQFFSIAHKFFESLTNFFSRPQIFYTPTNFLNRPQIFS